MSSSPSRHGPQHSDDVVRLVLAAVPESESAALAARLAACAECRAELAALEPVAEAFAAWPTDVLRPPASLWDRLATRIAPAASPPPAATPPSAWREPDWAEVAPGISVKLLATDATRSRVSMLVHLEPGVDYPPHRHAGVEELHLLDGELWIDDRKLLPGDYNRAEPGTADQRVWSETGCTCVLVTSPSDVLG